MSTNENKVKFDPSKIEPNQHYPELESVMGINPFSGHPGDHRQMMFKGYHEKQVNKGNS